MDDCSLEEGPYGLYQIKFGAVDKPVVPPLRIVHSAIPYVYIIDSRGEPRVMGSAVVQCEDMRAEAAQWLLDYCNVRFGA